MKNIAGKLNDFLWRCFNSFQSAGFVHHRIRSVLLRLVGCSLETNASICENVYIGSNKIVFGKNVFVNIGCFIDGSEKVELHEGVRLGPYVRILTGTHEYQNSVFRRNPTDEVIRIPVVNEIPRSKLRGIGCRRDHTAHWHSPHRGERPKGRGIYPP